MKVPRGFSLSGIHCGIKRKGLDLGLIWCENGAKAAGAFTQNMNPSYSVEVNRKHIHNTIHALIANSGNANCFTHKDGFKDTLQLCIDCARTLKVKREQVLFTSTGIIGRRLPFVKIKRKIPSLFHNLRSDIDAFSRSILTTDTFPKVSFRTVKIGREKVNIAGCAKGAGMINPRMATMLAFILTDADMSRAWLQKSLNAAVERSFNSICVDGCMSTNDSVFLLASGLGVEVKNKKAFALFQKALQEVCVDLARYIVKDGEGATKFIQIDVEDAKTQREAQRAFYAIAHSALFRAAMYGQNPNWGRIIAGLGQAGIRVDEEKFKIKVSSLKKKEIVLIVSLRRGKAKWRGWCCDITPEYVKINAGYS